MTVRNVVLLLFLFLAFLLLGCAYQPGNEVSTPSVTAKPELTVTPVETATSHQTHLELKFGVKYKVKVLKVMDGDTINVLMPNDSVENWTGVQTKYIQQSTRLR